MVNVYNVSTILKNVWTNLGNYTGNFYDIIKHLEAKYPDNSKKFKVELTTVEHIEFDPELTRTNQTVIDVYADRDLIEDILQNDLKRSYEVKHPVGGHMVIDNSSDTERVKKIMNSLSYADQEALKRIILQGKLS